MGGYMFFCGQTLLVHDTKWGGLGVVSSLKFSKIPLSDHGVHLKGLQTPLPHTRSFLAIIAEIGDKGEVICLGSICLYTALNLYKF